MIVQPVQPKPIVFVGKPTDKQRQLNSTVYYPNPNTPDIVILNGKGYPI